MPSSCFAAPALLALPVGSVARVCLRRRPALAPLRRVHVGTQSTPVMQWGGGRGGGVPVADRLLSVLPYLLPIMDSLTFGRFVFDAVPTLSRVVLGTLAPLYAVYRGVPFVALGVFFVLYLFVVRNANVSRFIRFNTFQALMLDIALLVPQLIGSMRLGAAVPLHVVELLSSSVFYAVLLAVCYAVTANLRGQLPDQIPGVSASVYSQMGPM